MKKKYTETIHKKWGRGLYCLRKVTTSGKFFFCPYVSAYRQSGLLFITDEK